MTTNETIQIERTHTGRYRVFIQHADGFLVLCETSTEAEAQRRMARYVAEMGR